MNPSGSDVAFTYKTPTQRLVLFVWSGWQAPFFNSSQKMYQLITKSEELFCGLKHTVKPKKFLACRNVVDNIDDNRSFHSCKVRFRPRSFSSWACETTNE